MDPVLHSQTYSMSCSTLRQAFKLGRHCARALVQGRGGTGLTGRHDSIKVTRMAGLHPEWSSVIYRGFYFQRNLDAYMDNIHEALYQALLTFKQQCDAGLASINI